MMMVLSAVLVAALCAVTAEAAASGPLGATRLRADGANTHAATATASTRFALGGKEAGPLP
jgi:hypothetical protein|eukprot:COSAG06_NODE_565_length_14231_cov_9.880979_3_plen_61_part_00